MIRSWIALVLLCSLCIGAGEPLPASEAWLWIDQLRPCPCEDLSVEANMQGMCPAADPDVRGTILVVGGRHVEHVAYRHRDLLGKPMEWQDGLQPFNSVVLPDGSVRWSTVIRFRYADGSEVDVGDPIQVSPTRWRVKIWNDRRVRSIVVYVGDTTDFSRLSCVLDGDRLMCDSYLEV